MRERCSNDGLVEPMFFLLFRYQPPRMGGVVQTTGSQSRCFSSVVAVSPRVWGALFRRRARRADESRPSGVSFRVFIGSRYSHGGVVLVGVSFRVFIGSRYSLDRLVEPMNRIRPASASEFLSGRVIRKAG